MGELHPYREPVDRHDEADTVEDVEHHPQPVCLNGEVEIRVPPGPTG
jgi:hypothetical protein